jgi:hypothetical protein
MKLRYVVCKRYTYSNMTHVHSIEISAEMARIVARAVSLQTDIELTWVDTQEDI